MAIDRKRATQSASGASRITVADLDAARELAHECNDLAFVWKLTLQGAMTTQVGWKDEIAGVADLLERASAAIGFEVLEYLKRHRDKLPRIEIGKRIFATAHEAAVACVDTILKCLKLADECRTRFESTKAETPVAGHESKGRKIRLTEIEWRESYQSKVHITGWLQNDGSVPEWTWNKEELAERIDAEWSQAVSAVGHNAVANSKTLESTTTNQKAKASINARMLDLITKPGGFEKVRDWTIPQFMEALGCRSKSSVGESQAWKKLQQMRTDAAQQRLERDSFRDTQGKRSSRM
jgi:hypothetical protein